MSARIFGTTPNLIGPLADHIFQYFPRYGFLLSKTTKQSDPNPPHPPIPPLHTSRIPEHLARGGLAAVLMAFQACHGHRGGTGHWGKVGPAPSLPDHCLVVVSPHPPGGGDVTDWFFQSD